MIKFDGGLEAAARMLAGLDPSSRARILQEITAKDPNMAMALKNAMVTFEDLALVTVKQLQELLREIKIADLALGLRAASKELKDHFYNTLPKSLCREIDEVLLGPPRPLEQVLEAQEKVLSVVRTKIDRGELVLSRHDEPMV